MTPNVIITLAICGTVTLGILISGVTTCFVAKKVCDAVQKVFAKQAK